MLGLIGLLLVIWVVCIVLGFLIKGLFWLVIVGIVLFLLTGLFAFIRRRTAGDDF